MNERLQFVAATQRGLRSMTELCEEYGISRKTGYKILRRYRELGPEGLRDRSRAPLRHPNQIPLDIEASILRLRRAHPTWGSKKLLVLLAREILPEEIPARSTVDAILKRAGVVQTRRMRSRRKHHAAPVVDAARPNDVWSIDYKGWFRVGDGTRCDPLTVNDVHSRMSLACRALVAPRLKDVRARLERLFGDTGLPGAILSDNGPPFGSSGIGGLSRLGVWLLRLGVRPILIQPGRPDQNGRHERFHRTLKTETASPPRASIRAQQAAFDRFRRQYNDDRPHEALDMQTPSGVYVESRRSMPGVLQDHVYPDGVEERRVRTDGSIKWQSDHVFVGTAMVGELVGIEAVDDPHPQVYLGSMKLGFLHTPTGTILPVVDEEA